MADDFDFFDELCDDDSRGGGDGGHGDGGHGGGGHGGSETGSGGDDETNGGRGGDGGRNGDTGGGERSGDGGHSGGHGGEGSGLGGGVGDGGRGHGGEGNGLGGEVVGKTGGEVGGKTGGEIGKGSVKDAGDETITVGNGELPKPGEVRPEYSREAVVKENDEIQNHFRDFQNQRWGPKPEMTPQQAAEAKSNLETKQSMISRITEMNKSHYDSAATIAQNNSRLFTFSNHTNERHIPQVVEKTLLQADQNAQAAQTDAWKGTFSSKYSENTLTYSALTHDIGMAGKVAENKDAVQAYNARLSEAKSAYSAKGIVKSDTDIEKEVGDQIRKEHSLNSAMGILAQRDEVAQINAELQEKYGDKADLINVDCAAMLAAMHSKSAQMGESNGKVSNLSDKEQIIQYAQGLKQEAQQRGLTFNDDFLYTQNDKGERVVNEEAVRSLATMSSALRQGDAFRPSSDVQSTQAGNAMIVDLTNVKPDAKDLNEERDGVRVGIADKDGKLIESCKVDETGKTYASGEMNIKDITPGSVREDGTMYTDVELRSGNAVPHETGRMIGERVSETISNTNDPELLSKSIYRIYTPDEVTESNQQTIRLEVEHFLNEKSAPRADSKGDFGMTEEKSVEDSKVDTRVTIEFIRIDTKDQTGKNNSSSSK